jgi:hypothetical protein
VGGSLADGGAALVIADIPGLVEGAHMVREIPRLVLHTHTDLRFITPDRPHNIEVRIIVQSMRSIHSQPPRWDPTQSFHVYHQVLMPSLTSLSVHDGAPLTTSLTFTLSLTLAPSLHSTLSPSLHLEPSLLTLHPSSHPIPHPSPFNPIHFLPPSSSLFLCSGCGIGERISPAHRAV